MKNVDFNIREPLKIGLKRENWESAPNSMKADEERLYALRGDATRCCRAKQPGDGIS